MSVYKYGNILTQIDVLYHEIYQRKLKLELRVMKARNPDKLQHEFAFVDELYDQIVAAKAVFDDPQWTVRV